MQDKSGSVTYRSQRGATRQDVIRERERRVLLREMDEQHALRLCQLKTAVSRDAVRTAIADTIVTYRRARKGTHHLPRYPQGLVPAIDLVLRTANPLRRGASANPYREWDRQQRELLSAYRYRVIFDRRLRVELKNVLIVTLAGTLRAVLERRQSVKHFLPSILNAAKVWPDVGGHWSPDAVERRIDRSGGLAVADLAALVPLTKDARLRLLRSPFVMFKTDKRLCYVFLEHRLQTISTFPRAFRGRIAGEAADLNLLRERWPIISTSLGMKGIPYITCSTS